VVGFTNFGNGAKENQGSYSGVCAPAAIDYLKKLGVTAVELLPVHEHSDEGFLLDRGVTNYWGYIHSGIRAGKQLASRGVTANR